MGNLNKKSTLNNWFLEYGTIEWINIYSNKSSENEMHKKSLYIKVTQDGILLIEFYIDDIIFGSIDDWLS
jgi:hypothetical protein